MNISNLLILTESIKAILVQSQIEGINILNTNVLKSTLKDINKELNNFIPDYIKKENQEEDFYLDLEELLIYITKLSNKINSLLLKKEKIKEIDFSEEYKFFNFFEKNLA